MNCVPAYATAGLFTAVIILDLLNQRDDLAKSHLFLGVLAFLLVFYLCDKKTEFVAWGLLVVPFILIAIGFVIGSAATEPVKPTPGRPILPGCTGPQNGCGCPRCKPRPEPEPIDPSCPVPEPIIPTKKQCSSCTKG
jgi:hypothetical protein